MKTTPSALLSLGVLFFIGTPCNAQTFNRRFDLLANGLSQTAFNVEVRDDSTYTVILGSAEEDSIGPDLYFGHYSIGVIFVDKYGNSTLQKRFTHPWHGILPGWSNCCDTIENGYIVGGTVDDTLGNLHVDLIAFDETGDTIWTHEFDPGNDNWYCQQVKSTIDGGFLLGGNKSWGNTIEGFVIKTDSIGEPQWTRTYNNPGGVGIASVAPLEDGGYLLGGGALEGVNGQRWLLRVDSLGNPVWPAKIWGSPFNDAGLSQCLLTSDGDVIASGAMAYADDYDAMKPYLAKLDLQTGETIWEHVYGPQRYGTIGSSMKECTNTDLIMTGVTTDEDGYYIGFLLRTNADGDSLWMRDYYYADTLFSDGEGRLHDVIPTPDGGFIATGAAYYSISMSYPPGYSQDVWVLKVDSLGCVVPGCNGVTGITAQVTNLGEVLRLYPNPLSSSKGQLHVGIHLPGTFATSGPLTLTVTTLEGKMVLQKQVPTSIVEEVVLDVSSLAAGAYSLHLSDATRSLAGMKFVVE